MIIVYCGLPAAGKSAKLAQKTIQLLKRNRKLFLKKKLAKKRLLYTNMKLSKSIELEFDGYIKYWEDPVEITLIRDADIVIDELSIYFDAQNWGDLPIIVKKFLRLHRHYGVDIFAVAQDFDTIDISFRRLVNSLFYVAKLMGTPSPSATRPTINRPWSLSIVRSVLRISFSKPKEEYQFTGFEFFYFNRKLMYVFDTREELKSDYVIPLKHIAKHCSVCGLNHVKHS
jgi:hypothetical protein